MDTGTVPSGVQLPAREAEILACAAKGLTDKEIAASLGISRDTVGTYWRRILLRYNASSRTEVVARVSESNLAQRMGEVNRLNEEIRQKNAAQIKDRAHRDLLVAVQNALLGYVSKERALDEVLGGLLNEMLALTESQVGFVAEVTGPEGMQALESLVSVGGPFRMNRLPEIAYSVLKEERPYISYNLRGQMGMTEFLGLPVRCGAAIVGMIGIANRKGGYDADVAHFLEPLGAACGTIINSERNEAARKKAEEETAETVARLETLLNSLDSAVMFVDESHRVRYVNSIFCRHFTPGFAPKEIMGMSTSTLLDEFKGELKDPDGFLAWVRETVSEGRSKRKETVLAADGRVFVCDFDRVQVGDKAVGHVWKFTEVLTVRTVSSLAS